MASKTVLRTVGEEHGHWVGDGFPVRSLFSYQRDGAAISPFLLLDYAGPYQFAPTRARRGVGQHPHRGFETVTIVYEGEVEHRDSAGHGGVIGPGDVQWMTAGGGVIHEEYHAAAFAVRGGPFRMVQLWVNLPGRDKMAPAAYQAIRDQDIPGVELEGGAAIARVIAGELAGAPGPARTFTPINVWDLRLEAGADLLLPTPEGHTAMIVGLDGAMDVGEARVGEARVAVLSREGGSARLRTAGPARALVLTGEPIDEPIVGYGPFVMNSEAQIREAIADYNSGRFPRPAAA